MGIEQWTVIDASDPFERGPRAYFSGAGGKQPEDWFLERVEFEIDGEGRSSFFSHPWLGELRIQHQDTVILTLDGRLDDKHIKVNFHDKDEGDKQATLKSTLDLQPGETRTPLVYYPTEYASLHVEISGAESSLSFSFYGLTERIQSSS